MSESKLPAATPAQSRARDSIAESLDRAAHEFMDAVLDGASAHESTLLSPSQYSEISETADFPSGEVFMQEEAQGEIGRVWQPGEVVEGLYRIESVLARGGMGIVYQAIDLATDEHVVIKSLLPKLAQKPKHKLQFVTEAGEWVRLGAHPNIVRAHTVHEIDYLPHIVAEFVPGVTLADLLKKRLLKTKEAFSVAVQICWAIAYAHRHDLAHRDLKPSNILIAPDGQVKVADFGLAQRQSEDGDSPTDSLAGDAPFVEEEGKSGAGTSGSGKKVRSFLGTMEYAPPEQWQGKGDRRSDYYSFGVLLYDMFCGRKPFEFSDLKGIDRSNAYYRAHKKTPAPDPREFRSSLPERLSRLMLRCMSKDPDERPTSFKRIGSGLMSIAREWIDASLPTEPSQANLNRELKDDQAYAFIRLGMGCRFRGDYNKAIELFNQAYEIFEALDDLRGCFICTENLGHIFYLRGDYDGAIEAYKRGRTMAKKLRDDFYVSRCYIDMGNVQYSRGRYDQAKQNFRRCYKTMRSRDDSKGIAACYNNLANVFQKQGDLQRAARTLRLSLKHTDSERDRDMAGVIFNNMGVVLMRQDEDDRAVEMFRRAVHIARALGDRAVLAACHNNVGELFLLRGNLDSAAATLARARELLEALGDRSGLYVNYNNLADLHELQGQPDKARHLREQCLSIAYMLDHEQRIAESLHRLGREKDEDGFAASEPDGSQKSIEALMDIQHN